MAQTSEQVPRDVAINRLREALLELTDDDHSICRIAAEKEIFCGGFRRYSDAELRERYDWLARKYPAASREELEHLANQWQLGRQIFEDRAFACDVQQIEHHTCNGWADFSNEDLARFCRELLGADVVVTS